MRLVGILDRYGNTLTLQRDDQLNITRIVSPNGRWLEFSYEMGGSSNYRVTVARDNIGRTAGYTYDAYGRIAQAADSLTGPSRAATTIRRGRGQRRRRWERSASTL